ncbi:MAG: molybdenum cofactor biosynthesis protein MoaE [Gloeomargarita sp. SKYG116]|nr:molybdenum cofactor biosynthesis protein MoaE [Gloeomargarita sp. SKYG116]MDW8401917.1 molybdenum cofactor biosynthesis protein MoaE [Gloeomargarita sp. SKYGB_i_bin116]
MEQRCWFSLTEQPIDPEQLTSLLVNPAAGACVTFAGWVRNHHSGKVVAALTYQVYPELAIKEGERILQEALANFALCGAVACHRYGSLQVGDVAVWVGATAAHRRAAFQGAMYIIDEIKRRLPIWKKEHYADGSAIWVNCCSLTTHQQPAE